MGYTYFRPYVALRDYKYKAKIVPGKSKKGKSYKSIIENFYNRKDIDPLEKFLIKEDETEEIFYLIIYIFHLINYNFFEPE